MATITKFHEQEERAIADEFGEGGLKLWLAMLAHDWDSGYDGSYARSHQPGRAAWGVVMSMTRFTDRAGEVMDNAFAYRYRHLP